VVVLALITLNTAGLLGGLVAARPIKTLERQEHPDKETMVGRVLLVLVVGVAEEAAQDQLVKMELLRLRL
jgi:hypothetical protein